MDEMQTQEESKANNTQQIITGAICRVLEDWAMMLVDMTETSTAIFDDDQQFYLAKVDFHGVVSGWYGVLCQSGFVDTLAANVLGAEEIEMPDVSRLDALKEMANVLAGTLLIDMYGDDITFDLIMPEVSEVGLDEVSKFFEDRKRVYCYLGDDCPVAISYALNI